jgi:hypothetical protein
VSLHWRWLVLLLFGAGCFGASVEWGKTVRRSKVSVEMQVALPLFVQVAMAGGDRNLAANLAGFRALVVETRKMEQDDYRVLAKTQVDVSWLNPAHEDNYYIAAAILPWSGELDAGQTILRRASLARPFDYQPPFSYAFNLFFFKNDVDGAADWLRMAAEKLNDDDERLIMQNYAARWMDRSRDLDVAISTLEDMAKQSKRKDFRAYLLIRAKRLQDLVILRRAAHDYVTRYGVKLERLDQLVASGLVKTIPTDPFGFGFDLDAVGEPIILNAGRGK